MLQPLNVPEIEKKHQRTLESVFKRLKMLAEKNIKPLSYDDFLEQIKQGNAEGFSLGKLQESLEKALEMKEVYSDKRRTKKYQYWNNQVNELQAAVKSNGRDYSWNLIYYYDYLGRVLESGDSQALNKEYIKYVPLSDRLTTKPPVEYQVDSDTRYANTVKLRPVGFNNNWTNLERDSLIQWLKNAGLDIHPNTSEQMIEFSDKEYGLTKEDSQLARANIKAFPSYNSFFLNIKEADNNEVQEPNDETAEKDRELDVSKVDTDLSIYQQNGESLFDAAKSFYREQLQGKWVNTEIGKVHLLGSTWQKMKMDTKHDDIKIRLIPFVPQILKGKYKGNQLTYKDRTDGFVRFHAFSKQIKLDGTTLQAKVLVGERETGEFIFTAYSLHKEVMDSVDYEYDYPLQGTQGNSLSPIGDNHAFDSVGCNVNDNNINVNTNVVFDSIADGQDGWNIEIVKVTDKDGNDITAEYLGLEDGQKTQGTQEVQEEDTQEAQDKAYLQDIIAGKVDMIADGFDDKLMAVVERYDGKGGEMEDLCMQAVNAYTAKLDELSA